MRSKISGFISRKCGSSTKFLPKKIYAKNLCCRPYLNSSFPETSGSQGKWTRRLTSWVPKVTEKLRLRNLKPQCREIAPSEASCSRPFVRNIDFSTSHILKNHCCESTFYNLRRFNTRDKLARKADYNVVLISCLNASSKKIISFRISGAPTPC